MEQDELTQSTPRRNFLGKLAAGAAALGLASLPVALNAQTKPAQPKPNSPVKPAQKPMAAKPAAATKATASPADAEAWFASITGKHRIVFDCTKPNEVLPFAWPKVFLLTNELTGGDSTAMVILRHEGIGYAFEDRIWNKYGFTEVFHAPDPHDQTGKTPIKKNPFWKPDPRYTVPGLGEVAIGIDDLQQDGVRFCVCNMAITVFSAAVAGMMKMNPEDVKKDWMSGLLPGIQVVPSGVWAVNRAQEHGCSYCFAG
jgi:hypothetical protein